MKIAALGDIAFIGTCDLSKNVNAKKYFEEVAEYLDKFDLVIGNLETPFVTIQKPYKAKSAHIGASTQNIDLLKFLNVDIVTLANNHIYDFGKSGLDLTVNILEKNNIDYCGIDKRIVYRNFKGNKISVSGYCCYSTNALGLDKNVDVLNIQDVKNQLEADRQNDVFSLVNAHFGQEHVHTPNIHHLEMARMLSKFNDYVLVGSHPHVLQGIEEYGESLLAYSLGNFCFDDVYLQDNQTKVYELNEDNRMTMILSIDIVENKIKSYEVVPLYISKEKLVLNPNNILSKIDNYSKQLEFVDSVSYINKRQEILNKYISTRKRKRDLNWVRNRLNFGSVSRIINTRQNRAKYKLNIEKFLP